MNSSFLKFENQRSITGKTFIWDVVSGPLLLGQIKWYAPWRKYCFYPSSDTIWDASCLSEIVGFIDDEMILRQSA